MPRNFDAQLEAYLLADSERRDRSETKVDLGSVYTSRSKVIPSDVYLKKSWLVIRGEVAKTLVDGEEVIFNMFIWVDGHFKLKVRIQALDLSRMSITYLQDMYSSRFLNNEIWYCMLTKFIPAWLGLE